MPFCQNCGAANQTGKFCSECGQPVVFSGSQQQQVQTSGGKCGGCGKEIIGQYLYTFECNFHPECYKCNKCKQPIKGGYGLHKINGKEVPICEACGGRKSGFTVDPRTGEKKYRN